MCREIIFGKHRRQKNEKKITLTHTLLKLRFLRRYLVYNYVRFKVFQVKINYKQLPNGLIIPGLKTSVVRKLRIFSVYCKRLRQILKNNAKKKNLQFLPRFFAIFFF